MVEKKLFTIITSTLNCEKDLLDTSNSIREQSYKNFQWIIIDGLSNDQTLNVIHSNRDLIDNWISEPDAGIYNAWNKAIELIRGEWVIFLGAGDKFYSSHTLEIVLNQLMHVAESDVIAYGNVYQIIDDIVIYRYGRVDLCKWDSYRPKLPAHQGVFHRARLFSVPKPFDEKYKIVADSKFLLLSLMNGDAKYLDVDICKMMPGGVSSKYENALLVKKEFMMLERELGYKIPFIKKTKYIIFTYIKLYLVIVKRLININALRNKNY